MTNMLVSAEVNVPLGVSQKLADTVGSVPPESASLKGVVPAANTS